MLLEPNTQVIPCCLESPLDLLLSSNSQFAHEDSWMDQFFNEDVLQSSSPI